MYHRRSPAVADATTCSSMLLDLQNMWDEIGETDMERDKMIYQLEQECLEVYRKKVELTRKHKADLHQALAEAEAVSSAIISALGDREIFARVEKSKGTLKEQVAAIKPTLESLKLKKDERLRELTDVQFQISQILAEIAGVTTDRDGNSNVQVDERDLSLKRLGELKSHLLQLQKEKNNRLQKINSNIKSIHDLSTVMSCNFNRIMVEIHPCFENPSNSQPKSISDDTLSRLANKICLMNQEKCQRLKKLQELGGTLIELWNLMDTSLDEQKKFGNISSLISASVDAVIDPGSLALEVIEKTEAEVERLNALKVTRAKELVMKKQNELEEIYRGVHMDIDEDATQDMLVNLIDSGRVDLFELLLTMEGRIVEAKEEAQSRRDILDKVEKWKFACEEENWLDDYERDQNRYSAGRGAHKNLKRAEKARILFSKLPSMVENLTSKVKAWEAEKGIHFRYEKRRLVELLEEYVISRQIREEEKRRCREQKKLQEQLAAEQEVLYGSKPSPMRQLPSRKPLGQSCNANVAFGTPNSRRGSLSIGRAMNFSLNKEKKDRIYPVTPVNYVALAKDER